jgi:hypothetical protein
MKFTTENIDPKKFTTSYVNPKKFTTEATEIFGLEGILTEDGIYYIENEAETKYLKIE